MFRRRDVLKGGAALAGSLLLPSRALAQGESLLQAVARPQNLSTPIEYFDRLITPTDVFFVRSHFGPPALDRKRRLHVQGLVKKPLSFSVDELKKFPEVTLTSVLQCAGNGRALHVPQVPGVQWVHGAMGQASWTGVRLADVLAAAGVKPGAKHVQLRGADVPFKPVTPPFIRSIPIERARAKDALIAYRMNGEPLSLAHGAPLRLIVPGWAGDHWVKWLVDVRVQENEAEGFFMKKAYRYPTEPVEPGSAVPPEKMAPVHEFPVRSLIARPADGGTAPPGRQEVVGVAVSGHAGIRKVEVSIDGGATWKAAALEGEPGLGRWQVFRYAFDAQPGSYTAQARATDAKGSVQPVKAQWNPSGYFWNAIHSVTWRVG